MKSAETKVGIRRGLLSAGSVLLATSILATLAIPALATDPKQGEWQGTADLGTRVIPLVIKLNQGADGNWSGGFEAPGEKGTFIELSHLSVSGSAVSFRFQSPEMQAPVIFSGNYQPRSDAIQGVFLAAGYDVPVRLVRVGVSPGGAVAAADSALAASGEGFRPSVTKIRHEGRFAWTTRGNYWIPIRVIKEDRLNINDIATAGAALDLSSLRWYVIDDLALFARYVKGGLNFEANQYQLGQFGDLTYLENGQELPQITRDTVLEIKGFEFGLNAYFGDAIFPSSRANPYVTASLGLYDWTLWRSGKDSTPVTILDEPVTAGDYGVGFGLGTEYPLGKVLALELEWMWRYLLTEDDQVWEDIEHLWTNTHFWSLTLGMVVNF